MMQSLIQLAPVEIQTAHVTKSKGSNERIYRHQPDACDASNTGSSNHLNSTRLWHGIDHGDFGGNACYHRSPSGRTTKR